MGKKILKNAVILRKVKPLNKKLKFYDAWISGRKSYQEGERLKIKVFEFK